MLKNYRKGVFLLAVWSLAAAQVVASHFLGSSISYEYVGNQTGVANQYRVTLAVEREATGFQIGASAQVIMKSSTCGVLTSVWLMLEAPEFINTASGQYACIPIQNLSSSPRTSRYSGTVVVPPGCPDFKFYFEQCCRPPGITSMIAPQTQGDYIEAELNNTVAGHNSSPVFAGVPNIFQCVNNPVKIPQRAVEFDGDSVFYELIDARQSASVWVSYAPGYSGTNPINSSIGSPLILDPSTGLMELTGASPHKSVVVVKATEFRLIPATGVWVKVGSTVREIFVEFVSNCSGQEVTIPLDTAAGWAPNAAGLLERQLNCGDSTLRLPLAVELTCGTLLSTDLRLVSGTGTMLPVKRTADSCTSGLTQTVDLIFHGGLFEGTYYITSGPLDDSPVLMFCSPTIDTIGVVVVNPCAPPAVISCPGVLNCDTLLTTSGPFTYFSSWSDTSGAGVPQYATYWSVTNGSLSTPADGDTVEVQWLNGPGTLILETRYGFCADYDTLHVNQTVGLQEPRRLNLALRPNPAADEVWLSGVPPESEVVVYTTLGQPVLRPITAEGREVRLSVANLARGTYWVSVFSATGRGQIALIKL